MAGKIVVSTLNNDTGVLATQNGMTGIAKAWINFNGTSGSGLIRNSFNVSSFTRVSQGVYTIAFATAMPNANYIVNINTSGDQNTSTSGSPYAPCLFASSASVGNLGSLPTTSGFGFGAGNWSSSGVLDPTYVCVTVFGS